MSEKAYYEAFLASFWADPDETVCRCTGRGWVLSELDTWHKCPYHAKGKPHPEYESTDTEYESTDTKARHKRALEDEDCGNL